MIFNSKSSLCNALLAFVLTTSLCSHAATVSFQDRNYDVSTIPLAAAVPASANCDLIFVILPSNQKYLAIPADPTNRAVFDPNAQRFYRIDRSAGLINGFTAINSSLINLDGTLFQLKTDTPQVAGNGQSTLESYSIPLDIDANLNADISVLDDSTLAYRTSTTTVYEITRTNPSVTRKTTPIPLKATGRLAIDFDAENGTHLLVEQPVTDLQGTLLPTRISAYFRDGTKFSEIILDNNASIPGYMGNASGVAWDVDTGDIYLLDGRQLILFKLLRPALTSVSPNHGPPTGAITVNIFGANIPPDALVFFDGVQATNIVVKSDTQIICNPPAHALGVVDITMTGTGILPGQPVRLAGAFTYGNSPPTAVLFASPTQGASPLDVSFDVSASSDTDGTLSQRVLDFGDGTSFTFPSDLSVVTVSHTYTGNGTFTASLTVTDDLNATSTPSTQIIIVGTGGDDLVDVLVLRTLVLKIDTETPPKDPLPNKDRITITGEVVLPLGIDPASLAGGNVSISVNGIVVNTVDDTVNNPGMLLLGTNSRVNRPDEKFSLKLKKKPGTLAGTYSFSYLHKNINLYAVYAALPNPLPDGMRLTLPVSVTIFTVPGRSLYYGSGLKDDMGQGLAKQAVVNFRKTNKSTALSLVRK